MGVVQSIKESITEHAQNFTLKSVQVGVIYTAVQLNSETTGVAYTFPRGEHCGPRPFKGHSSLVGRKADEIIPFLGDKDLLSSTLAMATVNAILASEELPKECATGDILNNIDVRNEDRVCMVGCFYPIIAALKKRGIEVISVDEIPKPGTRQPEEVDKLLPVSQIVIISATSIINNTIDDLMKLSQFCREVVVLGPSTPLLAEAFDDTPVSCLSGIRIMESEKVLQVISEGGGFRQFKDFTQKVNLRLR
jgi:uncharacterized protein (DUF4213/DUF364 family)